jgi:hypothetical protein
MPRTVRYNILLDFSQSVTTATGRFQMPSPTALLEDNSRTWICQVDGGPWQAVPPVPGKSPDSAQLQADDAVSFCFGDKYLTTGGSASVSIISVAVTFGRANQNANSQRIASPFFATGGGPKCLFSGHYAGQTGAGITKLPPAYYTDKDGKQYTVDWYQLDAAAVNPPSDSPRGKYEFMIGANAVTYANANYSFGHDPEVDIGNFGALSASA